MPKRKVYEVKNTYPGMSQKGKKPKQMTGMSKPVSKPMSKPMGKPMNKLSLPISGYKPSMGSLGMMNKKRTML